MGVDSKLKLWQLAATMIGNAGGQVVTSVTAVKPYEVTFDALYDDLRIAAIKQLAPEFARREAELRTAPSITAGGVQRTWTQKWAYVYIKPETSIKFLGFQRDDYSRGLVANFEKKRLPIQYVSVATNGGSGPTYTLTTGFGGYAYRNSIWFRVEDESFVMHEVRDEPGGSTYVNAYRWLDEDDASPTPDTENDYNDSTGNLVPNVDFAAWDWGTTDYPASITVNAGIEAASEADWSEHILCDLAAPIGVYLIDVEDVTLWSSEFILYLAADLAERASIVHAKSAKIVQLLRDQKLSARSQMVISNNAEDDQLEDRRMSSAERARQ